MGLSDVEGHGTKLSHPDHPMTLPTANNPSERTPTHGRFPENHLSIKVIIKVIIKVLTMAKLQHVLFMPKITKVGGEVYSVNAEVSRSLDFL